MQQLPSMEIYVCIFIFVQWYNNFVDKLDLKKLAALQRGKVMLPSTISEERQAVIRLTEIPLLIIL